MEPRNTRKAQKELIYEEESYAIRGAIFSVYKEKGYGFLEAVYQECLSREFTLVGISHVEQVELNLSYKGSLLKQNYKPNFVCYEKIIIEIKAVKNLADEHRAQLHNYLKATGMRLGLLVSFGHYPKVEIERIVI